MKINKIIILSILLISYGTFNNLNVFSSACGGNISCKCGDTITSNYILNENLSCETKGLYLQTNTKLDCNGYTIQRNNNNNDVNNNKDINGISILGYDNTQITNCKIKNFQKGILISLHTKRSGNGWGATWRDTIYSRNTIIKNNIFSNNVYGVVSSGGIRDKIYNNSFLNNNLSGIYLSNSKSEVWNNSFLHSQIKYSDTKDKTFCQNDIQNNFLNDSKGPSCSCIIPYDNLKINSNVKLCLNEYNVENILLDSNSILDCQGSILKGKGNNQAIIIGGGDNNKIINCKIENYSTGILITTKKAYIRGVLGGSYSEIDYPNNNYVYNNKFKNLKIGVSSSASYKSYIVNNSFNEISNTPIALGNQISYINGNLFSKKNLEFSSTAKKTFCVNGIGNVYVSGATGPSCSCYFPQEGVLYNSQINFCKGEYNLKTGIKLGTNGKITCLGTHLIGEGSGSGISVDGARETRINNCTISNYNAGISYSQKYVKKEGYYISYHNELYNSTIYDVNYGIMMNNGYLNRANWAEKVINNSIYARKFSIYNTIKNPINIKNNYWGSNNDSVINSSFFNSDLINYKPFKIKNNKNDFSISKDDMKNDPSTNKISFIINKNELTPIRTTLEIEITQLRKGKIINHFFIDLNDSYSNKIIGNFTLKTKEDDELILIVNPKKKVDEENFNNNIAIYKIKSHKKYILNVNSGLIVVDEEIRNYLKDILEINDFLENNAINDTPDFKINIKKNNVLEFAYPFENKIISYDDDKNKNLKIISIEASDVEGILAGVKKYTMNKEKFENSKQKFYTEDTDIYSLRIYDYLQTKLEHMTNTNKLRELVREILYDKMYTLSKINVPINSNNQTIKYNLWELKPKYSNNLRKFLDEKQTPIVMGGGLWSDITTWKLLGSKLATIGFNVYLIELTGSKNSECDSCYDYPYEFLTNTVFPTYINFILNRSNSEKVKYVGHSNGARVPLDSLTQNKLNPKKIDTFIAVGVPGAFDGRSLLKREILKFGNKSIKRNSENKHVSFLDIALFNFLEFENKNKISSNLWKSYYNWITQETDIQPGINLSLSKFILIGGDYLKTKNDLIVTMNDEKAIFENINSPNKKMYIGNYKHLGMSENINIQNIIKKAMLVKE